MVTLRLYDGYDHTSPELTDEVLAMQIALGKNGFEVVQDGRFGTNTQDAVLRFQAVRDLYPDGVVGPQTWGALLGKFALRETFETSYKAADASLIAHAREAFRYLKAIRACAAQADVPVAVVFGIGSRESGWGLSLTPPGPRGTGDFAPRRTVKPWRNTPLPMDGTGFGKGLMQIDHDAHEFARVGNWYVAEANIQYAASVMSANLTYMSQKYSAFSKRMQLRLSIAAYNCGAGNVNKAVKAGRDIDYYTAHRDYSRDVLSRAGWFQVNGWT